MHRSSESVAALASALAKAQAELINPEKSLIATIRSGRAALPQTTATPDQPLRRPELSAARLNLLHVGIDRVDDFPANIPLESDSCENLRKLCLSDSRTELRACYPLDIVNILTSIGRYEKRPVTVTKDDLQRAVSMYFAKA